VKKPSIPQVPRGNQPREAFDLAVKENIELITGRRGGGIQPLATDASLADVIAKINELVARIQ
jgi:hypothetical protein